MAVSLTLWIMPRHEDLQTALWCPNCLKPSGFELPCDVMTDSGVTSRGMTLRKCRDCDGPIP